MEKILKITNANRQEGHIFRLQLTKLYVTVH